MRRQPKFSQRKAKLMPAGRVNRPAPMPAVPMTKRLPPRRAR